MAYLVLLLAKEADPVALLTTVAYLVLLLARVADRMVLLVSRRAEPVVLLAIVSDPVALLTTVSYHVVLGIDVLYFIFLWIRRALTR